MYSYSCHKISYKDSNACHSSSSIIMIVESRSAWQFGSKASISCSQMNEALSNGLGLGLSQGLLSQRLQLLTNCKGMIAHGCSSDSVHEFNDVSCKNLNRACICIGIQLKDTKSRLRIINYLFFLNPSADFPLVFFGNMNFCIADGTSLRITSDGRPSGKQFLQKCHCL